VERRPDPKDRRLRRAYLTPAGAAVLAEAHRQAIALEERMTEGLSELRRREFRQYLVDAAAALCRTDPASIVQ
jgi:DNA-binding MarR family transcriptional regulator